MICYTKVYFAWEPRGEWRKEDIRDLCGDLNLIHCVDPFKDIPLYGKIAYLRLHGVGGYQYKYTNEDLKELYNQINKKTTSYIMFNNVYMFDDALRFSKLIKNI